MQNRVFIYKKSSLEDMKSSLSEILSDLIVFHPHKLYAIGLAKKLGDEVKCETVYDEWLKNVKQTNVLIHEFDWIASEWLDMVNMDICDSEKVFHIFVSNTPKICVIDKLIKTLEAHNIPFEIIGK